MASIEDSHKDGSTKEDLSHEDVDHEGDKKRRRPAAEGAPRKYQPLAVDEHGHVLLPAKIGILTIKSLGSVVWDRDAYHNQRYIFPVGYESARGYLSMKHPEKQTLYISRVLDGGDVPRFEVVPEDDPSNVISASTATGAWTAVIRAANAIRKRSHSNSASGPDYFGFSHPTIAKLIQELPDADKCKNYVMQKFVVAEKVTRKSHPEHSTVLESDSHEPTAEPSSALSEDVDIGDH